jgi:hypothetical protein
MSIPVIDLAALTEATLAELIGISETQTLEFKGDTYGTNDQARRELCKDVSAMANSGGGDIVVGMAEQDHVATSITGLSSANAQAEIQRLQNIISMAIEPPIIGVRFRVIELNGGKQAIVIRVPRSLDLPHRVTHSGVNRFYVRRTADTYEAGMLELRRMFELAGAEFDKADEFRSNRLNRLEQGLEPFPLRGRDEGYWVLHIVPFGMARHMSAFDLASLKDDWIKFQPIGSQSSGRTYVAEGFVVYRAGTECYGYTAILRTGAIEAATSHLFLSHFKEQGKKRIQVKNLANDVVAAVTGYMNALRSLGATGPWIVMLSLMQCKEAELIVPQGQYATDTAIGLPLVDLSMSLPPVLVDQQSTRVEIIDALRPMLDALWQGAGLPQCDLK